MNAPHTRRTLRRSIGALAAGFFVTAALSLGTDAVMHGTGVFPGWGEPMSDGLFAWATAYLWPLRSSAGMSQRNWRLGGRWPMSCG